MDRRNTIQREMVLNAVRSLRNHATAQEVYASIVKAYPTIGMGTVYRNLNILADEGEIKKLIIPGGPDRFEHTLTEHYHVKCIKCGRLFDVDMDVMPDLIERIRDKHGMEFLGYDILFNGICPDCK